MDTQGLLYIIATPIGNLADMTYRAVAVLQAVDVIAAEDTRHSRPLLQHYGIKTPLLALHAHNEQQRSTALLQRLLKGENVALISDAGTPLISDPGYYLVREVRAHGIKVVPIPGACAAIAALSAAGLPTDRFIFEGFLSAKASARQKRLAELKVETGTLVFYESPHRILDLLQDMLTSFGADRYVFIARELTKQFETLRGDKLDKLLIWVQSDAMQQKGEFVVLVQGSDPAEQKDQAQYEQVLRTLLQELPVKQAVNLTAQLTGSKKNEIYKLALQWQAES
jgi:16S rRNA (cytidine1402-2'-O)-methyltransferase